MKGLINRRGGIALLLNVDGMDVLRYRGEVNTFTKFSARYIPSKSDTVMIPEVFL